MWDILMCKNFINDKCLWIILLLILISGQPTNSSHLLWTKDQKFIPLDRLSLSSLDSFPNIHMCIFVSLFIFVIFLYLCHFPSAGPPMPGERSCSIAALNLSVFHNFYAQHSLTTAHPSISCISPFILRLLTFTVYTWYLFMFFFSDRQKSLNSTLETDNMEVNMVLVKFSSKDFQ